MAPEGMVHALELIHRLLKSGGRLIDIRPGGEPPPVYVRSGAREELAGWLQETDDFVEYPQAEAALAEGIERGWFSQTSQSSFTFSTYAGNIAELKDFLMSTWSDVVISDELIHQAEILQNEFRAKGDKIETFFRERIQITLLHRMDNQT
jgi:hypothetical protein